MRAVTVAGQGKMNWRAGSSGRRARGRATPGNGQLWHGWRMRRRRLRWRDGASVKGHGPLACFGNRRPTCMRRPSWQHGQVRRRVGSIWPADGPAASSIVAARRAHRRTIEQQETGSSRVFAPGGMPQAEVADLVQASGQDVLQEPAHELMARDAAGPPSVRLALLVANGDAVVVEADDAGVGDGHAEDVAGEVVEHGLLAFTPGRAMDHPGLGPGGPGEGQVGTALLRTRLAACRARAWPRP